MFPEYNRTTYGIRRIVYSEKVVVVVCPTVGIIQMNLVVPAGLARRSHDKGTELRYLLNPRQ